MGIALNSHDDILSLVPQHPSQIFKGDNRFLDWFNKIKMGVIERQPVTIKLLDESGAPTMVWTLKNAWPTKITGTDMKSDGNEVGVETLEMTHEGIEINS